MNVSLQTDYVHLLLDRARNLDRELTEEKNYPFQKMLLIDIDYCSAKTVLNS